MVVYVGTVVCVCGRCNTSTLVICVYLCMCCQAHTVYPFDSHCANFILIVLNELPLICGQLAFVAAFSAALLPVCVSLSSLVTLSYLSSSSSSPGPFLLLHPVGRCALLQREEQVGRHLHSQDLADTALGDAQRHRRHGRAVSDQAAGLGREPAEVHNEEHGPPGPGQ